MDSGRRDWARPTYKLLYLSRPHLLAWHLRRGSAQGRAGKRRVAAEGLRVPKGVPPGPQHSSGEELKAVKSAKSAEWMQASLAVKARARVAASVSNSCSRIMGCSGLPHNVSIKNSIYSVIIATARRDINGQ